MCSVPGKDAVLKGWDVSSTCIVYEQPNAIYHLKYLLVVILCGGCLLLEKTLTSQRSAPCAASQLTQDLLQKWPMT